MRNLQDIRNIAHRAIQLQAREDYLLADNKYDFMQAVDDLWRSNLKTGNQYTIGHIAAYRAGVYDMWALTRPGAPSGAFQLSDIDDHIAEDIKQFQHGLVMPSAVKDSPQDSEAQMVHRINNRRKPNIFQRFVGTVTACFRWFWS